MFICNIYRYIISILFEVHITTVRLNAVTNFVPHDKDCKSFVHS